MTLSKDDLNSFVTFLQIKGYKLSKGVFKNEDFGYWKTFDSTEDDGHGYQLGLVFYDHSRFDIPDNQRYGIQFEFTVGDKISIDRADFTICDEKMTVEEFEEFSRALYAFIVSYMNK
jgi:hypothetical protein